MATKMGLDKNAQELDLLLHPELLSRDFLLLTLQERKISVDDGNQNLEKDKLTDLYVQHVIPLPRRDLPKTRWGKNMEKKRGKEVKPAVQSPSFSSSVSAEASRKRPHITFGGSSTSTALKIKKTENNIIDRLKPPPSGNTTNLVKLSSPSNLTSSSTSPTSVKDSKVQVSNSEANKVVTPTSKSNTVVRLKPPPVSSPGGGTTVIRLKREAPKGENDAVGESQSSEPRKKIQHITWP